MAIDSSGIKDIIGVRKGIDLPQVQPTQVCAQPGLNAPLGINGFLVRVDNGGNVLQSSFLQALINPGYQGIPEVSIIVNPNGASVIFWALNTDLTTMNLGPATSEIALACAGNAASFVNMPLASNEIVSVVGTGLGPATPMTAQPGADGLYPFQLGGTQITFDGLAAPLLYVSGSQVNLVTPEALKGETTTQICAVVNSATTNCIVMPVQFAAPGIFSSGLLNGGQIPYAAAVNQDGTINSAQNPAAVGSIVALFVTGLGSMTPSPPDGGITPVPLPAQGLRIDVQVTQTSQEGTLPGESADVLYAGPAPLEIEGLGQINVRVPGPALAIGQYGGPPVYSVLITSPDDTEMAIGAGATVWTY